MERHKSHLEEHSTQWGHQKQNYNQTVARLMNRRVELWNDKETATTLAAPGAVRTGIGRKIWSKIPHVTAA